MWPASIGGTYIEWDERLNAFTLGHEEKKYAGVVGSPQAVAHRLEFFSNSGSGHRNSLLLQPLEHGQSTLFILIAASTNGPQEARKVYDRLLRDPEQVQESVRKYYSDYLSRTVSLELPDDQLQAAYDWSRISVIQGLVNNPFLGSGLIAGYRTAGDTSRPGFAWFFGRDSLWTDLALDSVGDFKTARAALEFISQFQRADGKIEHEIPQTATLVPWFGNYPYAYAAADATPLYILAVNDYVSASGDIDFLERHWDNVWRAYHFLHSTYNAQGLPQNLRAGHGWVEGGPLLPVVTELYQSGLGTASLHAIANLASLARKPEIQKRLETEFIAAKQVLNDLFWSAKANTLIFALNDKDQQVELPTVLSTAPMWFDVFDEKKANATIDHLASGDHTADWGMRIFSNRNLLFDPAGYHYGSVWPLFTGWASVGEYIFHRPLPAYTNLQANSHLALDGSAGHTTEVLSGTYYEALPSSSPHQIWSSAMVVLPVIRGLLAINNSVTEQKLVVAPHVPANWNRWSAGNVPACSGNADLIYERTAGQMTLQVQWRSPAFNRGQLRMADAACTLIFSPGISLHATTGEHIKVQETLEDRHPTVSMQLRQGLNLINIPVTDDFGIVVPSPLPSLGGRSRNLRIIKENWSADRKDLHLDIQGIPGHVYRLKAYGSRIVSLEGGEVLDSEAGAQQIEVSFPSNSSVSDFTDQILILHFAGK
jgi:glycogen debranching enzyme